MNDKIDALILLIENQQEQNRLVLEKADNRKKSDSVFIKIACTLVTLCAGFIVTNTMDISKKLEGKADRYSLAGKLSTTAYAVSEEQRAETILNYIDYTSKNYLIRDEELRIAERGRVEKSLGAMIHAVTARSGK